jgi:DNA-binding NtrC family response regulator
VDVGSVIGLGRSKIRIAESKGAIVRLHPADALGQLRGRSTGMRGLMAMVQKLAATDSAVLLIGESGTGKELVARALHDLSARQGGPFVTVDCGAIADSLVTSELFGHERGAFTGAERQHVGAFERARGGTVFLDEIGELSPALQAHLLGVLERRRIRRVGGSQEVPVDVRVLSATNRDIRAEVNKGTFRLDLFYRLAVVCLELPPLRDRQEDIPLLVEHFLHEHGYRGEAGQLFPPPLMDRLQGHAWPGNVRELRNLVEATLATGESLGPVAAGSAVHPPAQSALQVDLSLPYKEARAALLNDFEARYLRQLLDRAGGNVSQAARDADMTRSHLNDLLRKHGSS